MGIEGTIGSRLATVRYSDGNHIGHGCLYFTGKSPAAHNDFAPFDFEYFGTEHYLLIIEGRLKVFDGQGPGCVAILRLGIDAPAFGLVDSSHGGAHAVAIDQGGQYAAVKDACPPLICGGRCPPTDGFASFPLAFDAKAFRMFCATSEANISGHVVLKEWGVHVLETNE